MTQTVHRPTERDVKTPDLAQRLFGKDDISIEELQSITERVRPSGDSAAEAVARFWLANYFDGNLPGAVELDHKRAVAELDRCIELFPSWPEAYFNRAIARLHNNDLTESIDDFDRVERLSLSERHGLLGTSVAINAGRILGKTLLFRAEARTKRRLPNDITRARNEISQAIGWLANTSDGAFWLATISRRLDATFTGETVTQSNTTPTRVISGSFLFGVASAFALLLLLVVSILIEGCST